MIHPTPKPTPRPDPSTTEEKPVTFRQCLLGSGISSAFAVGLYLLTTSIAQTFAAKPIPSSNAFAIKISLAVRTLVVGAATLATAIFAVATVGLIALGIQTLLRQRQRPSA